MWNKRPGTNMAVVEGFELRRRQIFGDFDHHLDDGWLGKSRIVHLYPELSESINIAGEGKNVVYVFLKALNENVFFSVERLSEGWSRIDSTSLFLLEFAYSE